MHQLLSRRYQGNATKSARISDWHRHALKMHEAKRAKLDRTLPKSAIRMWNGRNTLSNRSTGSSQKKHFLPFRVLLNVGIDPEFPKKSFFFFFSALFREKFRFPAKTFLA